jgi:hypothetical protein
MDPTEDARRQELAKEARRIQEDTEHSGAQHFAAGQWWAARAFWLGLPVTVLIAVTSAGAGLSAITGGATWLTALLTFAVAVAVPVRSFIDADGKAKAHSSKGARYFALRDDARRFANIEVPAKSLDALSDRLLTFGERQKALRDEEPREVKADLREKVRKGIESGDYRHEVDRADGHDCHRRVQRAARRPRPDPQPEGHRRGPGQPPRHLVPEQRQLRPLPVQDWLV